MAFKSTYTISEFLSWCSYEMLTLAPKMNFKELVFLFHLLEVFNKRRMDAPTTPPITDNVACSRRPMSLQAFLSLS
jgi:hypothetical protein